MTSTTVPDVLRNAADIIDKRGWHQSRDVDPATGGGVCANGAMRLALGNVVAEHRAVGVGIDRFSVHAPTDWSREQMIGAGRMLTAALNSVGEFMWRHGLDQGMYPDNKLGQQADSVPSIIRYNDRRATCPEDVTKVLRDAATWLESAPLAVLDEIERTPRVPTPYGSAPFISTACELVNA